MVEIRELKKEDIDRVVYLEETFLGESLGKEILEEECDSKIAKFYVATIHDTIVGYIGRYAYLDEAEILNFVVDEAYQRQGIGQKLLNKIKEDLPSLKKITLEVRASNQKSHLVFIKKMVFIYFIKEQIIIAIKRML